MFRRTLQRSVNWGKLIPRLESEEAKTKMAMLRAYYGNIEALERKHPGNPAPLDWAAYKEVVQTPGVVDALKKNYDSLSFEAPQPEDFEGMLASQSSNKSEVQKEVHSLKTSISDLEKRASFEEANKTSETTTLDDWKKKYPEAYAEAEAEVSKHEWFSGVVTPYGAEKEATH